MGAIETGYMWCEHCQVIQVDPHPRATAPASRCPLCDGSFHDLFPWGVLRREDPSLPEVPEVGARLDTAV